MDKRSIIAIALVFVILLLWPLLFGNRKKPSEPEPIQQKGQEIVQKQEETPKVPKTIQKPTPRIMKGSITTVQTPLYEAQITSDGGRIISWKLKEYLERTEERGPINLIPHNAQKCLAIQFNDPEVQNETEGIEWEVDKESLNLQEPQQQGTVTFRHSTSNGMVIVKKMTFSSDSYIVGVDIDFQNASQQPVEVKGYDLCWGEGLEEDALISPIELANEGPVVLMKTEKGSKLFKHWQKSRVGCFGGKHTKIPNGEEQNGPIDWVCFAGKYFSAVLMPEDDSWWTDQQELGKRYKVTTDSEDISISPKEAWFAWGASTTIALTRRSFVLPVGGNQFHKYRAYVGPKKWSILRNIGAVNSAENLKLGKLVRFGAFTPVGKATLWFMQGLYSFGKNYGISIIFISVLIKIIYLPLTQKSYNSMGKMQELQPKFNELREKYRDDPQRLNKETMKLYKQYGASPFTGCLPLLLQIPVFWALFSTLRGAVELRDAVFISGWINDLSQPENIATIAGFPIRILPLLMTGSSLSQQFIFGTGSPGQNNKMMAFMPVFMLFIFYGMPSGLVLYWLCNDVMTFAHRYFIKQRQDKIAKEKEEDEGNKNYGAKNKNGAKDKSANQKK